MLSKLLSALRPALVCTLSLLATASLAQTTIHVGPGQAYTTIQSGIDAAQTGDTVLVAPGTYNENIDFKGKAITVTSSGGASRTILDGGSKGPAVSFVTGETPASTLSGFTIQHGGNFTIDGPDDYTAAAGSINITGSSPTIADNIITLSNCWGIVSNYSFGNGAPTIRNNTISATQDKVSGCSITGGAAIVIWGGLTNPNYPGSYYGGLIYGNTLEKNVDSGMEDSGGNGGAGIVLWGGSTVVAKNIIRNNASPGGTGGAIHIGSNAINLIYQNLIYGNSAGCGGGALSTIGEGVYVINNTIVDNTSTDNAGYSNCIDIAQIYPSPDTYGQDSPSDIFLNNIISGSTSYPAVDCDWFDKPSEANQPTFQNKILYNAGGPFFGSYCVDVSDKYNNIAADPQFTDPANHDYTLKRTSPAIDHGQNSVLQTVQNTYHQLWTQDFAGNPRVADVLGNGCLIDIGAYEYPGNLNDCGVTETLKSSLNPAMAGQLVTFTAQLTAQSGTGSGTPTGLIEFLDGNTLLASQAVSSTGSAAFSTSKLAIGSHTITANYQPTGNFGAGSASLVEVIDGDPTTTALSCQPNTIGIDGTSLFTATVKSANGTPTGSIAFTDNGASLATQPLLNGSASYRYRGLTAGTHAIIGAYAATGSYGASSSNCTVVVQTLPSVSTLSAAPARRPYGVPILITANVAPASPPGPSTPTGTVTFLNGTTTIATATLANNGQATITTSALPGSALPGGTDNLTCTYSGSTIYAPSNCNTVPVVVSPAASMLTLSSSANPSSYTTTITVTARLTFNGMAAGAGNAIALTIGSQRVTLTTEATGSASYRIGSLIPGSYPVTASFPGTNDLLASSASLTEVITPAPTSIALTGQPNPGNLNQLVALTATVTAPGIPNPPANGSVTLYDGATSLITSPLSSTGTATKAVSFSTLGVHNLIAVYGGDADFSPSTSAIFQETIQAGDFSISVNPTSAIVYTGIAAPVKVSVGSLQGFNQPLALSCSGLPANTTCAFTPASLPTGQGDVSLVIQTTAPKKSAAGFVSGTAALLGALTFLLLPRKTLRRRLFTGFSVALFSVLAAIGLAGCASPHPISGGTPPGTYKVAVTATAGGDSAALTHSAIVTLTVKSLF